MIAGVSGDGKYIDRAWVKRGREDHHHHRRARSAEQKNIPLSPCVPENLVSRDGFGHSVPRQPAHSLHSG